MGVWRIISSVSYASTVTFMSLVFIFNSYILLRCCAGSVVLPWCTRIRIALGAAQGLAYLHEETQKPVIYRDFKASNILLDAVIVF